jgi:hypothetical protein
MASFIAPRFGSQWAVGAASTVWNAESDFGKLSDGFLEEEVSPVSEGRLSLGRALGVLLGVDLFDLRGNRVGSGQVVPGTTRPGGRSK